MAYEIASIQYVTLTDENDNSVPTSHSAMDALRYTGRTKKLDYVQVPKPELSNPDEVLVRVAFSGVCGTDLHIVAGEFPSASKDAVTLGHEFSGTVAQVGSNVKNVALGDKVVVDPNDGCTCCVACHSRNPHYCITGRAERSLGTVKNGGFAPYVLVSKHTVHRLPPGVTLQQGALAEPISCISHGWDLLFPIPVGSRVLIMGAGIIGSLWACLFHLQGHRNVTISEPVRKRLEYIAAMDTGFALLTPEELEASHTEYDLIVDCSGHCPAIQKAIGLLKKGGRLCCFGVAPPDGRISISPFELFAKEATILSVNINPFSMLKAVGFIEAMGDRYLDYTKLGIEIFTLEDYKKAFEKLKSGSIAKAMFKFD